MASTARRSILKVQPEGAKASKQAEQQEEFKTANSGENGNNPEEPTEQDSENARLQKRLVQMQYLEQENQNLLLENEDLNTTLKINKDIIKSMLQGDKKYDAQFEYAMAQITQENELWETRVKTLTEQRDRLQAEQLMQQQIISNVRDKEDDVAEIYKDEIDELKENLERKEYLLQLAEQRVAAYEKLLMNLGARDAEVQAKLNEQKIVLKDRKITNVVMENGHLKEANQNLMEQNNMMREQLESVLSKLQEGQVEDPQMMVEEISIFQNKMTTEFPQKVLEQVRQKVSAVGQSGSQDQNLNFGESAMQSNSTVPGDQAIYRGDAGPTSSTTMQDGTYDQREYVKKLEHSVQWLEEKLQRARNDFKTLKKENANLKDSNENHIFINEKLNKALKKSEDRIEKLTQKIKTITNESIVLPKRSLNAEAQPAASQAVPVIENGPEMGFGAGQPEPDFGEGQGDGDFFNGDVSSIMIKPDQILNDQNIAGE